jgi:hypothetical protein
MKDVTICLNYKAYIHSTLHSLHSSYFQRPYVKTRKLYDALTKGQDVSIILHIPEVSGSIIGLVTRYVQ